MESIYSERSLWEIEEELLSAQALRESQNDDWFLCTTDSFVEMGRTEYEYEILSI
jgi:hypothetical protein